MRLQDGRVAGRGREEEGGIGHGRGAGKMGKEERAGLTDDGENGNSM